MGARGASEREGEGCRAPSGAPSGARYCCVAGGRLRSVRLQQAGQFAPPRMRWLPRCPAPSPAEEAGAFNSVGPGVVPELEFGTRTRRNERKHARSRAWDCSTGTRSRDIGATSEAARGAWLNPPLPRRRKGERGVFGRGGTHPFGRKRPPGGSRGSRPQHLRPLSGPARPLSRPARPLSRRGPEAGET
jgi:hypothetical protein